MSLQFAILLYKYIIKFHRIDITFGKKCIFEDVGQLSYLYYQIAVRGDKVKVKSGRSCHLHVKYSVGYNATYKIQLKLY